MTDHHGSEGCRVGALAGQHAFGAQIFFNAVQNKRDGQVITARAPEVFLRLIFEAIAFPRN